MNALLNLGDALTQDAAFSQRYLTVLRAADLITHRPVFGYATSPIEVADNQVLFFILRYGFPFIIILFLGWLLLAIEVRRCFGKEALKDLIVLSSIIAPFAISGEFLDNFRLLFFAIVSFLCVIKYRAYQLDQCDNRKIDKGS